MPRLPFTPRYSINYANSTSAKTTVTSSAAVANLLPETNNKFAWSIWFYSFETRTQVEQRIWDKSQHSLGIFNSPQSDSKANKINFRLTSGAVTQTFTANTLIAPNQFYHLVANYDQGTVSIYLNGIAQAVTASGAAPTLDASTGSNLFIGNRSGNARTFQGKLALPRMFQNKTLSQAEVNELFKGKEITEGLVLRYDYDEQQGSAVTDKTANAYHGTNSGLTNTINCWVSERQNRLPVNQMPTTALNFIPTGSQVIIPDTAILRPEVTGVFTWSAWVRPFQEDFNILPFIMQKSSHYICFMGEKAPPNVRNRQFALELANSSDGLATEFWSSMRLTMNKWNHVIARFDGQDTQMFIDGHKDPVTIVNDFRDFPLESSVGQDFTIGNRNGFGSRNFPGYIGKCRYYNVVLTDDECFQVYNSDSVTRGLIGKWNLDEGTGSTANDTSGNGNHGTITNAAWVTLAGRIPATRVTAGTRTMV